MEKDDSAGGRNALLARLEARGVSRREFLRVCTIAAAAVGLPAWSVDRIAEAAALPGRPSVIWLHFQECTGCTESLLRTSHPAVAELILDLVSLDYHETLFAAAGRRAESALEDAMARNAGRYVCVIEGAIPVNGGSAYCRIAGRTAVDLARSAARRAGAIVAIGSCASWGGVSSAEPNPTGATGAPEVLAGKTVISLPGCPPNPYNLLGTVLQYATFGTLPALDRLGRPIFAYARTIHEDCPRRAHFDAGRFVARFGDENHRLGYCLYKTGCKGPKTHANCSQQHFAEVIGAWPVGVGHPCVGCTEKSMVFREALYATVDIDRPTPPDTYPPIHADHGGVSVAAVGAAGAVGAALLGAGVYNAKKLSDAAKKEGSGDAGAKQEEQ
ncbi:MAG: hydrogenase small subunit [Gemmatimonadota bacterium]